MLRITSLTDDPLQKQTIFLPNGESVEFILNFKPMQLGWFINEMTYNEFVLKGMRITNSPNMLHQFINKIPFGLGCFSKEDREPTLQEDFTSGNSSLYILTQEETEEFRDYLRE